MGIKERVNELLTIKKLSQSALADGLGLSRATVNQWLKRENSFGLESVRKLLIYFPDLNARWLILGEGEMLETSANANYELKSEVAKMVADELKEYGFDKKNK